jgi:hypothetical protein
LPEGVKQQMVLGTAAGPAQPVQSCCSLHDILKIIVHMVGHAAYVAPGSEQAWTVNVSSQWMLV